MSDKRGIDEVTIYNVSTMDWLLAVSYRDHRSYRIHRIHRSYRIHRIHRSYRNHRSYQSDRISNF